MALYPTNEPVRVPTLKCEENNNLTTQKDVLEKAASTEKLIPIRRSRGTQFIHQRAIKILAIKPMKQRGKHTTDEDRDAEPSHEQTAEVTEMEVDPQEIVVKEEKVVENEESAVMKRKENSSIPTILLSGLDISTKQRIIKTIIKLGGVITLNPKECTHLVMMKLGRTSNMLMCLPGVKYVVGTQWVVESGEAGQWISEEGHMLTDPQVERTYNFNLVKTLARNNRDKLFIGKVFYVTPNVLPSLQVLTDMITFSGGRVENSRRSVEEIGQMNRSGNVNYIIITCEQDIVLVMDVLKAKLGVYTPEFVMGAITRCEMNFDLRRYLSIM